MRTIERAVYKYDELSDDAKEYARQKFNESEPYHWGDDAIESIEALARHFSGSVKDYELDWLEPGRCSGFTFSMPDMPAKEIKERLAQLGSYNKRTGKGHGDCKLTGVFTDEECIDGFRSAWRGGERDLSNLMHAAGEHLQSACMKDYEYQLSEEAFRETCEANGYEFYENGDMA